MLRPALKPFQEKNIAQEKKQSILRSINVEVSRDEAEKVYDDYIEEALVIKGGEVLEGEVAFDVELAKEIDKAPDKRHAPLYVANKDGETYFIIPMRGKGLWGPIWGYISLESDVNTVYGAIFDHKSETPGLGAEIATPVFMDQFQGKKILNEAGKFVSIQVRKGNAAGDYEVDGISGGTITSDGVQAMIDDSVGPYISFLKAYPKNTTTALWVTPNTNEIATIE
ncbi:MAG: NADH:ubiquinone reductase (Na(+)-transporting) subunit C [Owenweeksia sp.]|nr:NADH:ubiquinone reductase (Na(+)-transporting) subunit C [Owenweeksia sp.]